MKLLRILSGLFVLAVGGLILSTAIRDQLGAVNPTADYRHYMYLAASLGALMFAAGFAIAIDFPRGGVRVTDQNR